MTASDLQAIACRLIAAAASGSLDATLRADALLRRLKATIRDLHRSADANSQAVNISKLLP